MHLSPAKVSLINKGKHMCQVVLNVSTHYEVTLWTDAHTADARTNTEPKPVTGMSSSPQAWSTKMKYVI